jgi:hypothetical protein
MNDASSRSHAVFIIIVENSKLEEDTSQSDGQVEVRQSFKVGKLNLVGRCRFPPGSPRV